VIEQMAAMTLLAAPSTAWATGDDGWLRTFGESASGIALQQCGVEE